MPAITACQGSSLNRPVSSSLPSRSAPGHRRVCHHCVRHAGRAGSPPDCPHAAFTGGGGQRERGGRVDSGGGAGGWSRGPGAGLVGVARQLCILAGPRRVGCASRQSTAQVMLSPWGTRARIVLPTCFRPPNCPATQVLPSPYEPCMPPVGPRRVPGSGARLASLGIAEGSAAGGVARRAGSTPNITDQLVGGVTRGVGGQELLWAAVAGHKQNLQTSHSSLMRQAAKLTHPACCPPCWARSLQLPTTSCWPSSWTPSAC